MEAAIAGVLLTVMALCITFWLYIRSIGRVYFWGRIAARAKANHEASIVREQRDEELKKQWLY
jgi:hypothetical protein